MQTKKNHKKNDLHFRVDTPAFFKEINDGVLKNGNFGVLAIPFRVFCGLLGQVAKRSTELNDPILNKLMFDLNLYDLPKPSEKEYSILMEQVYKLAEEQEKIESNFNKKKDENTGKN